MLKRYALLFSALLSMSPFTAAPAAEDEEERLLTAIEVLEQISAIPEQNVPPVLLGQAYAVAVIPNVFKGAFIVGGHYGKGVVVVRLPDGSWSNPSFVKLTGGSFGWQLGAQSTDVILVFKSRKGVDSLTGGKLTLGADASVAAGPVGRQTGAATDIRFEAEVYSYSRSRGLFAGVALNGTALQIDEVANEAFYGVENIGAAQVFADGGVRAPAVARQFIETLDRAAPDLPASAVAIGAPVQEEPPEAPGLKTYPIGEPEPLPEE